MEKNNIMMDTASKKMEQLKSSVERMSESTLDAGIFKFSIDGIRGLVDLIDKLNRVSGGLPGIAIGFGAVATAVKTLSQTPLGKTISSLSSGLLEPTIKRAPKRFLGMLGISSWIIPMRACDL